MMTNHETSESRPGASRSPDDEVRDLLRAAGRRPQPPAEDLAAINAAARSAWEDLVRERRESETRRFGVTRRRVFALAAGLALAVLAGWLWVQADRSPIGGGVVVAHVELVKGGVMRDGEALSSGAELRAGDEISTGPDGRLAARMSDGQSLRVDHETTLKVTSPRAAELLRGAVYVDSPPLRGVDRRVDIATPLGTVVEIGTQYEVRLDASLRVLEVRVREGAVSVRREGKSVTARLGEELTVRHDGSVSRAALAADGEEWSWVLDVAPFRDIQGERLGEVLAWLARETGWSIRYESAELERAAAEIRLNGSVEGLALRPDQTLEVALTGSGLAYRLEDGVLSISRP